MFLARCWGTMQLIEQTVCFDKKPRQGPARPSGPQSTSLFGPVIDFDHPRQFFLLEPHSFGRQPFLFCSPGHRLVHPGFFLSLRCLPPQKHSLWSPIIDFRLGRTCQPCNTTAFCPHLGLQLTSIATVANTFQTKHLPKRAGSRQCEDEGMFPRSPEMGGFLPFRLNVHFQQSRPIFAVSHSWCVKMCD